jgi:hypothetical protein
MEAVRELAQLSQPLGCMVTVRAGDGMEIVEIGEHQPGFVAHSLMQKVVAGHGLGKESIQRWWNILFYVTYMDS